MPHVPCGRACMVRFQTPPWTLQLIGGFLLTVQAHCRCLWNFPSCPASGPQRNLQTTAARHCVFHLPGRTAENVSADKFTGSGKMIRRPPGSLARLHGPDQPAVLPLPNHTCSETRLIGKRRSTTRKPTCKAANPLGQLHDSRQYSSGNCFRNGKSQGRLSDATEALCLACRSERHGSALQPRATPIYG